MNGKQLADTHCGLMILPLLSSVIEQLAARTGANDKYEHCLSPSAIQVGFFSAVENHPSTQCFSIFLLPSCEVGGWES